MQYISNTDHYKEVLSRVQTVKHSLWISTADIKDLYVERARRRNLFLLYWPIFISKGVEVRLIHANEPGPAFRKDFYNRRYSVLCESCDVSIHNNDIMTDWR